MWELIYRVRMTWNLQLRGPNGTVRRIQYDENERLETLQSKSIASIAVQRMTHWNYRLYQTAFGVLSRRQNPAYAHFRMHFEVLILSFTQLAPDFHLLHSVLHKKVIS